MAAEAWEGPAHQEALWELHCSQAQEALPAEPEAGCRQLQAVQGALMGSQRIPQA